MVHVTRVVAAMLAVVLAACATEPSTEPAADPTSEVSTSDTPTPAREGSDVTSAAPTVSRTRAAPLPVPRTEVTGAVWDGGIVVVGGLDAGGATSDRADRWDPATDTWSPLPDLPMPLHHTTLGVVDGDLWLVGGYVDGFVPVAGTWRLSPGAGTWVAGPDLPEPRGAPAVAVADSGLWVLGGVSDRTLSSTVRLRPDGSSWAAGPELAVAREHLGAAVLDGAPLAVAGRDGGLDTNVTSTEVVREETVEPGPPVVVPRGGTAATTLDGVPCVAGGETPTTVIAEVECLVDGAWRVVGELAEPRHGLAVVAFDGALHVIGGGPEPGLTVSDAHEVLRPGRF